MSESDVATLIASRGGCPTVARALGRRRNTVWRWAVGRVPIRLRDYRAIEALPMMPAQRRGRAKLEAIEP